MTVKSAAKYFSGGRYYQQYLFLFVLSEFSVNYLKHEFLEYTSRGSVVLGTPVLEDICFFLAHAAGEGAHVFPVPFDIVAVMDFLLMFFGYSFS